MSAARRLDRALPTGDKSLVVILASRVAASRAAVAFQGVAVFQAVVPWVAVLPA